MRRSNKPRFQEKLTKKIWLGAASVVGARYVMFYVEISSAQDPGDLRLLIVKVCSSFCSIDKQEIQPLATLTVYSLSRLDRDILQVSSCNIKILDNFQSLNLNIVVRQASSFKLSRPLCGSLSLLFWHQVTTAYPQCTPPESNISPTHLTLRNSLSFPKSYPLPFDTSRRKEAT